MTLHPSGSICVPACLGEYISKCVSLNHWRGICLCNCLLFTFRKVTTCYLKWRILFFLLLWENRLGYFSVLRSYNHWLDLWSTVKAGVISTCFLLKMVWLHVMPQTTDSGVMCFPVIGTLCSVQSLTKYTDTLQSHTRVVLGKCNSERMLVKFTSDSVA